MKLSTRDANVYFKRPDTSAAGCLIFGDDAMRVALKRQDLLSALLGENAEEEMRLTRMTGADLRSDNAGLLDAVKAVGFFPGRRAVLIEGATDGLSKVFSAAFEEWQEGDAQIIATAGRLTAKSALRKVFEGNKRAYAAAIYDDPPGRAEIDDMLKAAGITEADREASADLEALARAIGPGDFRQMIEKLGLYKSGDATPVTPADIEAVAPLTREAELDDILHATAEADAGVIGPLLTRLKQQGTTPVSLCIAALRHFRALHMAAAHPNGPAAGLQAMRPPVFGPRRDRMARQAGKWGRDGLETALSMLIETDLILRSASTAPQMAVMERTLIRLAMLPGRGRR
ncbi:DNA polymerase III subunit delta [Gymnodinialimonas ceratoperidinii]|uniref:DNA polymerase III subunit delta n=1 Tax=Gymnodinialimonas ceratoperidinii TaxID=2856823 RepID=A0A8F6YAR7_9RHOB|nr:DNA polymerase III subunit delta [Gymnodinialimonas ceratoperidinii]QXT39818.1 DNA polymerase III subunit delta [Gymnodinialimonas ceratoperidinii]